MHTSPACLDGIRAVDLTQVIAGPYCGLQLALLGAEVIKIEAPQGDPMRWRGGSSQQLAQQGLSTNYQAHAKGRQIVYVDWNSEKGQQALRSQISTADIFICNLRAHVLPSLGLSIEHLRQQYPRLVICTLSGYIGEQCASWPAYDNTIQAACGLMHLNGSEASGARVGTPIMDYACGMAALSAILGALFERERSGNGQHVHVNMLAVAHQLMTAQREDMALTGQHPRYKGNRANSGEPLSMVFETADGFLALAVNEEHQFRKLACALGCEQWLTDARFSSALQRKHHALVLQDCVQQCLRQRSALSWESILNNAGVAAAAVRTLAQSFEHPGAQLDPELFSMERGRLPMASLSPPAAYAGQPQS